MKRKNFVLSVAASAVIAAFPAIAQDSSTLNVSPEVEADANVGMSNNDSKSDTDIKADIGSSPTVEQSTSSSGASAEGSTSGELAADTADSEKRGKARGHDEDKLTGLDRADQVAGEHGKHGRDNAREKQGLN